MTTEEIQERIKRVQNFSIYDPDKSFQASVWEIALQLSILNSRSQPQPSKDSAGEPEERLPHAQLFAIYHLTKAWAEDKTGAVLSKVTLDKIRELCR